MSVVVVKYADGDRTEGLALATALKDAGLDVAAPGDRRTPGIEDVGCHVLLWSKAAASAPTAPQDIQQAVQAWSSGRFVLVALDDAPLPVGLRDLPAIAMPSDDDGWANLAERIQDVLDAPMEEEQRDAPARNADSRRTLLRSMLTISAGALLTLGAVLGSLRYFEPETRDLGANSSDISYVIAFAVVGAAAGAMMMWAWSRWRQRTPPAAPSAADAFAGDSSPLSPRIFVSYSRRDAAAVENLVKDIEGAGHQVWIDRDAEGAQRYAAAIVSAIKNAELVALMGSRNAFASDHVIREIYVAGDHKKRFLVFQLDQTDFPDEVLYFTSGFPRISTAALDRQRLRTELSRLLLTANGRS